MSKEREELRFSASASWIEKAFVQVIVALVCVGFTLVVLLVLLLVLSCSLLSSLLS